MSPANCHGVVLVLNVLGLNALVLNSCAETGLEETGLEFLGHRVNNTVWCFWQDCSHILLTIKMPRRRAPPVTAMWRAAKWCT